MEEEVVEQLSESAPLLEPEVVVEQQPVPVETNHSFGGLGIALAIFIPTVSLVFIGIVLSAIIKLMKKK